MVWNRDKEKKDKIQNTLECFVKKVENTTESYNKKLESPFKFSEKKLGEFIESSEKKLEKSSVKIDNLVKQIDKKLENFDEVNLDEKIERFLDKIWGNIVCLFTVIIPKLHIKIKRFLKSDTWGSVVPLVIIIITLIALVLFSTAIRRLRA